jgi:hypothetical protein
VKRKLFILLILLILSNKFLHAQNLSEVENRYNQLQSSYTIEKLVLDSLQAKLNVRAKEINFEKNKPGADGDKIASLMANSVNLSSKVEKQQQKIEQIEKSIESLKEVLNKKYAVIIDSLRNLTKKNKESDEKINSLILYYAAKRLEVTPGINGLSFNPGRILELDSKNPEDKKIYREYIANALKEVNNILAKVTEENDEISQVIELQRKTNKFLEETELESRVTSGKITSAGGESNLPDAYTGFGTSEEQAKVNNSINNNVKVYELLLNQLNTIESFGIDYENIHTLEKNPDLYSYEKLLKDIKKKLTEYKKLLEQKNDSFK